MDALSAALSLDVRSLTLLLGAGASCIHLDDFNGLLARPFLPGWRLWRGDACFGAPPPRAALLPGWLAHLDDDGTLVPTPAEHSWLHLLSGAPALRSLALENGNEEDPAATAPALHVVLCSLREAPALRKLALGFFDELRSEQLMPLLQLRRLTRLELSHIPDFSDALLLAVCHSLRALTHLRLDYLSVSDSGFAQLSSLKSLEWFELRVSTRRGCTRRMLSVNASGLTPCPRRRAPLCSSGPCSPSTRSLSCRRCGWIRRAAIDPCA